MGPTAGPEVLEREKHQAPTEMQTPDRHSDYAIPAPPHNTVLMKEKNFALNPSAGIREVEPL